MDKKVKFRVVLLLVLALLVTFNVNANAAENWLGYGGNLTNSQFSTSNTKTTNLAKTKTLYQGSGLGFSMPGDPVIYEGYIYFADNKGYLYKYDEAGTLIKKSNTAIASGVGYFNKITIGNNKLFAVSNKNIYAFDLDFNQLWKSVNVDGQLNSALVYYDNYLYTGVVTTPSPGDQAASGYFLAIDTNGSLNSDNLMPFAWTYPQGGHDFDTTKGNGHGYYYMDPVVINNAIIFVGDDGNIVSHDLKTTKVNDSYQIGGINPKVRSTIVYDDNYLYVATQNAHSLVKLKVNAAATFDKSDLKSTDKNYQTSGGIAVTDKYIYTMAGGQSATLRGLSIFDKNLNLVYQDTKHQYDSQSVPLVVKNDKQTLVYFITYQTGDLIIVKENTNTAIPTITRTNLKNVLGESIPFNMGGVLPLNDGSLLVTSMCGSTQDGIFIIGGSDTLLGTPSAGLNTLYQDLLKVNPDVINDESTIAGIVTRYNALSANDKTLLDDMLGSSKIKSFSNVLKLTTKSGDTTYYFKANGAQRLLTKAYKTNTSVNQTTTYAYNKAKCNVSGIYNCVITSEISKNTKVKNVIAKKEVTKYNSNAQKTLYSLQNRNGKGQYVTAYYNTISYYTNKKVNTNAVTKRYAGNNVKYNYYEVKYYSNGKVSSKKNINYYNNGKYKNYKLDTYYNTGYHKTYTYNTYNNKGQFVQRLDYAYNKKGQLKSNGYGKATKMVRDYKNGKLTKTLKYKYNAKGKAVKY